MKDYIEREAALNFETKITANPADIQAISQGMSLYAKHIADIPAADVVTWSFLERYADFFCAVVSMPEFVREAKAFYLSTCQTQDGGETDA